MHSRFITVNKSKIFTKPMWEIYDLNKRIFLGNLFTFNSRKEAKSKAKKLNTFKVLLVH